MPVLIVDGDSEHADFIAGGLEELGHNVHEATNAHEALDALMSGQFDVAVINRHLTGMDGIVLVRGARARGCQTAMLIYSTTADAEETVRGLEAGADDYIGKPFAFTELAARVMALGRRPPALKSSDILTHGDIELNLHRRTVKRGGRPVDLQPREFSLLEQLMRSPDRIVTRTSLLDRVWRLGFDPQTNIVETHMSRLRTKLNRGFDRSAIRTVRGAGYILQGDDG